MAAGHFSEEVTDRDIPKLPVRLALKHYEAGGKYLDRFEVVAVDEEGVILGKILAICQAGFTLYPLGPGKSSRRLDNVFSLSDESIMEISERDLLDLTEPMRVGVYYFGHPASPASQTAAPPAGEPSATRPSSWGSSCSTAPSSTSSATFCTTKLSGKTTRCWRAT